MGERDSERLLRAVFDGALDAMLLTNDRGVITDTNPAACDLLGLPRDRLLGRSFGEFSAQPIDIEAGWRHFLQEGRVRGEFAVKRADGTVRHTDYSATANVLPGVNIAMLRDITDRKQAEVELRRSDERFKRIVESASIGVWTLDATGKTTYVNRRTCEMFGYSADELAGRSPADLVHEDRRADAAERFAVREPHPTRRFEMKYRRKDGSVFWASLETTSLADALGNYDGGLALVTDITERRRAEEAMSRLATIAETSDDSIASGCDGVVTSWNRGAEKLYGYTAAEAIGHPVRMIYPPELVLTPSDQVHARILRGETVRDFETVRMTKDGRRVNVSLTLSSFRNAAGKMEISVITRDLTGRDEAKAALRESEERYRVVFDQSPLPMWVLDSETLRFVAVNQAAVEHYGYAREEFLGMTIKDLWQTDEIASRAQLLDRDGDAITGRLVRHLKKNGAIIEVEISAIAVMLGDRKCWVATAQDMTERKSLEDQLRQAQKMEAVGNLAGGVAHDFNNLLSVILCYSKVLLEGLPRDDPRAADVREIERSGERATELTRQLLAFSRRQMLQPRVVDVNRSVKGMAKMLPRLVGENIEVAFQTASRVGEVFADPTQLDQIIMNLVVNARDAMPEGGKLTVETANVALGAEYAAAHVDVAPGKYTMLAVSDTGVGMDAATQARMFEPFFTTKREKGTGLGLSTVFGIVKQSRGHIAVKSEPGSGTAVRIYLPHTESVGGSEVAEAAPATARGAETIALVEDEDQLRVLARRILTRAGYAVIAASNGAEALEMCGQHQGPIHLLLTDVIMPKMTGPQLAERLQTLRPGLDVLYMSGYTDGAIMERGVLQPGVAFLQKPLTPDALLRKVRDVIDAAG